MSKGYFYLFITALCWSMAGVFIRFNTQSGLLISCIGAIVAFVFNLLFFKKKYRVNKTVILVACIQVICGVTFIYANQLTSVGNAIVLQYTSMIFVVIYDCIYQRKMPKIQNVIVISIVLFGVMLFFMEGIQLKGMIGNLLAVISGAFFGLQFYVNTKESADAYSSCNISYLISICFIVIVYKDIPTVSSTEWLAMLGGGIIQTAIGGLMFAKGIKLVEAFSANLICMLEILFAPLWAFLLFHETVGSLAFIGAIIIIVGILGNIYLEFHQSVQDK